MRHAVLVPLGMSQSSYSWDPTERDHVATPYGWWRRPLPNHLFAEQAAAGLYTTAPDLARFVAAHMSSATSGHAGRGVLAPATAATLMEPNPVDHSYGLGLSISKLANGVTLFHHGGSNIGWKARILFIPGLGEGIVLVTNSDRGSDLIDDVSCEWVDWATQPRPGFLCDRSGRTKLAYVAGALLAALAVFTAWRWLELRRAQRRFRLRFPARRVARLTVLVIALVGWWAVLYGGIVLAGYFPPTFHWISVAYTLWMIVLLILTFAYEAPKPAR